MMKEFEIVVLFFILCFVIKNTPQLLSKKLWIKEHEKSFEKSKDVLNSLPSWMTDEVIDMAGDIAIYIIFAITILSLCFYGLVGLAVNDFKFSLITVIYMFLLIFDFIKIIKNPEKFTSLDINNFEFNRFRNILKLLFDYGYHIVAIYTLLHI